MTRPHRFLACPPGGWPAAIAEAKAKLDAARDEHEKRELILGREYNSLIEACENDDSDEHLLESIDDIVKQALTLSEHLRSRHVRAHWERSISRVVGRVVVLDTIIPRRIADNWISSWQLAESAAHSYSWGTSASGLSQLSVVFAVIPAGFNLTVFMQCKEP